MSHALLMGAEILGAVALAATGVGAAVSAGLIAATATTATIATIATFAALGAAVASVGAMALQKKPPQTVNPMSWRPDPLAGVPEIMGRTYYGGNITYRAAFGQDDVNETIETVYSIGPVKGMDTFYVDGVATTITGNQADILDKGKMFVAFQMGQQPEPHQLSGTNNPGITTASKLSGLAASTITLSYDTTGGHTLTTEPQVGAVWEGTSVYDPRKDSTYPGGSGSQRANDETTWSYTGFDNPGLRGLTHLIGRRQNGKLIMGLGASPDALIVSQYVECANICELNGWTMGGVQMSTDDKWDRLCDILQAGGAEPVFIGAQIGCTVNAPKVSLTTITLADVAGKCSVQATQPRKSRINGIVGRYMAEQSLTVSDTSQKPVNGVYPLKTTVTWGIAPAGAIVVSDYTTFDGGIRIKQVDYPYVQGVADSSGNAPNQLAQLVRYDIENAREFGPISLTLKLRFIGYRPGDVVTLNIPELGLVNQDVLIQRRDPSLQSATVVLTCRSETAAKHPFALGQTTTAPPTPTLTGPTLVSTPGAAAWAISATTIASGSTTVPALVITGATDSSVIDAVVFELRVYTGTQADDEDWNAEGAESPGVTQKIISNVVAGAEYQVAVSYRKGPGTGPRLILGPSAAGADSVANEVAILLSQIDAIVSDGILSRAEKPTVIQDVAAFTAEQAPLDAQAASLGVSSAALTAAYNALETYLGGLNPAWNDPTQDTPVTRTAFDAAFTAYETAKVNLVNAMAQASAQAVPTVNRVKLSLYERGTLGWAMNDNPTGTNPVLSVSTVSGKAVLGLSYTAQTGKAVSYGTNHPGYNFTVTPGEILACSGFVGGTGTGAQGIALLFVNAAGSVVSQTESPTVSLNAAFPTQVGLIVPVPATAVTAFVLLYLNPTANGAATASLSQVMVSSVSSAQTSFPVFVPGPNALDGADQTSQNTSADTTNVDGVPAATVNANIAAAANLASTANATAAIGAQLASDVADNNKFSSTEKKRWVEKITALNTTVPAEITQANALGLNAQATALNAAFTALTAYLSATVSGGPTSNTPPPNYLDTAHTSAISSNTFKSYVDNFAAAETALATAAQNYNQILSIGTTANLFTDDSFARFVTSNAEWLQISGFVSQSDTAGQRIVSTAGVGEAIAMAAPFSLSVNDRIDIQFEYYVDSNVPNTGTFGAYLQVFDANANLLGSFGIALAFNIVTRNDFIKMTGSFYVSQAVVQSGQNLANAAFGHIYLECQNHTAGSVYLRKPSAFQTPNALANLNSNGRGTTSLLNSTSVVAGIKILNNTGFVLSSTANGTTNVNINIAAFTYTTDTGVTLSYPSATIVGAPFSTTFYVWRIDPNLDGGTGYSVSQSLTDAAKPGNLYLGYLTTPNAAGTGGSGGGGGMVGCVTEDMWVATDQGDVQAKELRPGDRVLCLTPDKTATEYAEVISAEPMQNWCVTIATATGAELDLAINTQMEYRNSDDWVMAANAWSIDVASQIGGNVEWGRCAVAAIDGMSAVTKLWLGGRIFFAGRQKGRYVASHNLQPAKP